MFEIITREVPELDGTVPLQSAVKAVNYSVGTDSLVPTLLVYGALQRLGLPNYKPSSSMYQRASASRKSTDAISRAFARTQVRSSLNTLNLSDTADLKKERIGYHVLVYRPEIDKRDGPFTFLDLQGETCTVLLSHG